jgi:hypothetical protein
MGKLLAKSFHAVQALRQKIDSFRLTPDGKNIFSKINRLT